MPLLSKRQCEKIEANRRVFSDSAIFPGLHRDKDVNVTITEKRAPTDESVKLLREMEQAARDAVIGSIVLDSNGFKGVTLFNERPWEACFVATVVYEFNGKKETCEVRMDYYLTVEERVDKVIKELADHIARHTLNGLGKGLSGMFKKWGC